MKKVIFIIIMFPCTRLWAATRMSNWLTEWPKQKEKDTAKGEGGSYASNAYSLPVWLWQIVTLFAWLVEPPRRDWPCYIILPLSSSFLPSLIYQSYSPSLPFSFFGLWLKAVRPRPQFLLLLIRRRFFLFSLNVFKLFCNLMFKNFFNILDILDDITGGKKIILKGKSCT